jgi:peptidyl-prolyl cis-trans isomerase D
MEIMNKALEEIAGGKDFAEVAKAYSQEPVSAANGGLLEWAARGEIPIKAFEDAAFALKPGEISKPVRSAAGVHLIKLENKEAARLPDFAEVKDDIARRLGAQKADEDFHNVQQKAEDDLALGVPLDKLAESLKLTVERTGLVEEKAVEAALGLKEDSRQILQDAIAAAAADMQDAPAANATAGVEAAGAAPIPVPLNIEGGIALVRVSSARPSSIPPLEEVKARISAELTEEQSRQLAREAAEAALPSFSGTSVPAAFAGKAQTSQSAARVFPSLEPLGNAPELMQGLFSSDSGEWLPQVYATPQGSVIARCALVEPVSEKEWESMKSLFIPQMREARRAEALNAYMIGLDKRSAVDIHLDALDTLTFRRGQ